MALLALLACWAAPGAADAAPPPLYTLDVRVDAEAHTISGVLRVQLAPDDPRPVDTWWLRLPPNRFMGGARPGLRRRVGALSFGVFLNAPDWIDPVEPEGPDSGSIEIRALHDGGGRPLSFSTEADPRLPPGFHRGDALMRVDFGAQSSGRVLAISFVTRLPRRHWDGWDETGIFAESWHPLLLPFSGGQWQRNPHLPSAARFAGSVVATRAGWLKVGFLAPARTAAGAELAVVDPQRPSRTLPLILLWGHPAQQGAPMVPAEPGQGEIRSFFSADSARVGGLAVGWAARFVAFADKFYGLPPPPGGITIVQSRQRTGEIWTAANTVMVPTAFYRASPILDRVFVARLARAIAEVWFGETVFSDRDSQAWLHLGLTGFLALDFFQSSFGWDARFHDVVDWLSPKYREHHLETPTLYLVRKGRDTPLDSSLYRHPVRKEVMTALFHKAPLVFRSLQYLMGAQPFGEGLHAFFRENRLRVVDGAALQQAMEAACAARAAAQSTGPASDAPAPGGKDAHPCPGGVGRFFAQFFYGTAKLDYQLLQWNEKSVPGGFRVEVTVRRLQAGVLPVQVQLTMADGEIRQKLIRGIAEEESVTFRVSAPVARVSLDPKEFLTEVDRQNNHSSRDVRLRPIFDWAKQKETLLTVVARMGGNAIDGNYLGLGVNIAFDEKNRLSLIPISSQLHDNLNYEGLYQRKRVLHPDLDFFSRVQKLGGITEFNAGGIFTHRQTDTADLRSSLSLELERIETTDLATCIAGEPDTTNNVFMDHLAIFSLGNPFSTTFFAGLENSQSAFGSTCHYTRAYASFGHTFALAVNHSLRLGAVRGWTSGDAPLQKKHLLGDPLVLRGYPRSLELVFDHVAALRAEYRFVVSRSIFGEFFQSRKMELILSYDIGRGWDDGQGFEGTPTRRNAGIGFSLEVNALNLLAFPLRIEIAVPLGDSEFQDSQFIFFQALSFF
ncbi:MAG: hypothetical protein V3S29_02475 [bacterium]